MEQFILILHVIIAIAMTGFILLQQGKGAEMGASFGAGSSQTVFGSAGSVGFLTKMTTALALIFFATSITLAIFAKKKVSQVAVPVVPAVVEKAPAKPASPDVPAASASQPVAAPAPAAVPAPAVVQSAPPVAVAAPAPVVVAPAAPKAVHKKAAPQPEASVPAPAAPAEAPATAPVANPPAEPAAGASNP